jgi:AraC family transcriptional regulator
MDARHVFKLEETHQMLERLGANIEISSERLGWSSTFVSIQREPPFDSEFHAVPTCLIVVPRRGPSDMTYRMDGKIVSRQVGPDGLFFLPAGHACDVWLHSALDTVHVYLQPNLFVHEENGARDFLPGIAPMLGERDTLIGHLVTAIGKVVTENETASSLLADTIAQAMANRLIAINHRQAASRSRAPRTNQLSHRKVQQVRDFVEANLATDIKLRALADICGVSTEYFLRLFRSTIGVSPHQYVLNLRIGRAKALLGDPGRSLSDIAQQCGFAHQQHLISTFRRFTGLTPGQYRRL